MKMHRLLAVSTLLLGAVSLAVNPPTNAGKTEPAKPEVDSAAAFFRLKALAGEWDVDSPQGKGHSRFEVIANNTVVLEHFTEPGMQEMLTAYYLDGAQLVLTHYCEAGNQPHMVAQKFDAASGELDFAFAGGSNIDPGTAHMHNATFQLTSNDAFAAKWDFMEGGKMKFSMAARYTRAK